MMDLSFFADMAWKSALIAGSTLALGFLLRSRSAADRALVLRIGVVMLLLLPLLVFLLPAIEVIAFAAPEPPPLPYGSLSDVQLGALSGAAVPAPEPTIWDDPTPLVLLAYAGGLAMVGSRLLAGLCRLRGWTRSATPVVCPEWLAAFERVRWMLPDDVVVRLLSAPGVPSPLSWGWRHPVILLDPDTLADPEDADAILAHEVAHVARRDWPMLILSRMAATLFWFNPLVWRLEREVVQQAEEAADVEAAERVEPARYAETLLNWAHVDASVPAHAIAPSARALGRRIKAILDRSVRERQSGSAWTAFAMLLCIGIAAPVAATQLVAAQAPEAPEAPEPPAAPAAPAASTAPIPPAAPAAPRTPNADEDLVVVIPEIPDIGPAIEETLTVVLPQIPTIVANATSAVSPAVIEHALRDPNLTREQRKALRDAMREARRVRVVTRADVDAAVRAGHAARAVRVPPVPPVPRAQIEVAMREARHAAAVAPRAIAVSMAHGADGMLRGAAGMEAGAGDMERQAERLQDRDYRERQIARARARGETLTHEQLLDAAEGLREGAEGMREGAREMREAAENMRARHP